MKFISPMVVVVGGEPLASSLVIAEGMRQKHSSTMSLTRKHISVLEQFGVMRFEIVKPLKGTAGGRPERYALLNERQAALLISMMRNTDEVVTFKAQLIHEFYRMRDALSQRTENLYQQLQALVAEEVSTQVRASFGSRLMLERKRAIPDLKKRRERIEAELQPELFIH